MKHLFFLFLNWLCWTFFIMSINIILEKNSMIFLEILFNFLHHAQSEILPTATVQYIQNEVCYRIEFSFKFFVWSFWWTETIMIKFILREESNTKTDKHPPTTRQAHRLIDILSPSPCLTQTDWRSLSLSLSHTDR